MAKEKILILGGSHFQVPLIHRSKKLGLYTITCDYLPANPGHRLADEYHNVSTTDKNAVLDLAAKLRINAIATLSSDPAIPTVAYVAEKLGLPGPSINAVTILSDKYLFRQQMVKLGLNHPGHQVLISTKFPEALLKSTSGCIVKPVDACGSKGITYSPKSASDVSAAVDLALRHSRSGRCIVEEFIDGDQIHGDGYFYQGKLIYLYLGDHYFFTKTNNFIPVSTRWPCKYGPHDIDDVKQQVERLAHAVGYTNGPVNIEARVTGKGNYLIEVAPRNGGNFVPIIQQHLTGFNFIDRIINEALGSEYLPQELSTEEKVGAYYILHAEKPGFLAEVVFDKSIEKKIFFVQMFKKPGEPVEPYVGSHTTLGVVLLEFDTIPERNRFMNDIDYFINLIIH